MTLIEGVGDEVIHFFLLLALAFIAVIAWWSTNLSDRPFVTTFFILERQTVEQAAADAQLHVSDVMEPNDILTEEDEVEEENKMSRPNPEGDNEDEPNTLQCDDEEIESSASCSEVMSQNASGNSTSNKEGNAPDPVVRNRIVASFEMTEEDDADDTEDSDSRAGHPNENKDTGKIRIKLKYLNEDQKLVEGKLQERLGDFKRRHFSLELAGRKLVRLIFNGQVLQEDTKTLQNCGFFDNCVVHCVVQSRTPPPSPNLNRSQGGESRRYHDGSETWDFAHFLYVSLTLLLGLAWYGRYQYAQLYTATTTVALVGLTGIFTVSLIGMYMPDSDGLRT